MGQRLTDYFKKASKKKLAAFCLTAAFSSVGSYVDLAVSAPYQQNYENTVSSSTSFGPNYTYSDLITDAEAGRVERITQKGDNLAVKFKGHDGIYNLTVPKNENVVDRFDPLGVKIKALPEEKLQAAPPPQQSEGGIPPFFIFLGVGVLAFFVMQRMAQNRMQNGGGGGPKGGLGNVGKSKAKLIQPDTGRVTFDDVAGADEAKEDLQEIIEFLKTPEKFGRLGGKVPKGVLLVGPPGTGKTLTAKAVAGESGVPFFQTSGSDFVEMYVGVGAARVRDMFTEAKAQAPCILFIDEIDAIGKQRGRGGSAGSNDEREQTLNQILVELDGFEENTGVIVMAATNRDDVLDKALLRPGRFDRKVVVPLPDLDGRKRILDVHMRQVPIGPDVSSLKIARGTPGFSGADLANLVNEAALLATRRQKNMVNTSDIEDAKDKIMMGAPRNSNIMSPEEVENTAWHEAGHALVALYMGKNSDPIHKATIVPRGQALGMVMRLPEKDRVSYTKAQLKAEMAVAYGGRWAEELYSGNPEAVTTGASNDIQQATNIATKMVREWGLSEKLGLRRYNEPEQHSYLGAGGSQSANTSEKTAQLIDDEINSLITKASEKAKTILTENKDQLEVLAKALIEHETLTGEEIKRLVFDGKPIVRNYDEANDNSNKSKPQALKSRKPDGAGGPAPGI